MTYQDEEFSNCCGASRWMDETDICADCKEHADFDPTKTYNEYLEVRVETESRTEKIDRFNNIMGGVDFSESLNQLDELYKLTR